MSGIEIALIIGAAVAVAGSLAASQAQAQSQRDQAELKEKEAAINLRNAGLVRSQADVDAEDERRETRRRIATIRAQYGENGFTLAGTPLSVLRDATTEGELSARRGVYKAEVEALGLTDSANFRLAEASSLRRAADDTEEAGLLQALGQGASFGASSFA